MKPLLISACLLGVPCRYDGKSKGNELCKSLEKHFYLIPICPEVLGGLSTPRLPCERQGSKIICCDGSDRTKEYTDGAHEALKIAKEHNVQYALMKEKSPSCGKEFCYDGSFQKVLIRRMGVTSELLTENGITVFSENEIAALFDKK
jgi:uncharacterized protein YbbK (DUF523 family)